MIRDLLLIDNFDSFTYNLVQCLRHLSARVQVARNDELTVEAALALSPGAIVLSPGPGRPEEAGVCLDLLRALPVARPDLPLLGVCLGHQALGLSFGAKVVRAAQAVHGKVTPIHPKAGEALYSGLPDPFSATRYHSLIVTDLPDVLVATAWSPSGEIMAMRHASLPLYGVQFHPESIGTPLGAKLLANFLCDTT